ncbi:MAG: hypothetical protein P4K83_02300 [Terracidiphilus sp.]|nr:hypothetical protein [Terracidiphilus sp.]
MIFRKIAVASLFLFGTFCAAQAWSGIIDPSRAIDWSDVGIPGGIPSGSWARCAVVSAAQAPCSNGTGDCTATIQAALDNCATNQYVLLAPGTFRINGNLWVHPHEELRGSGADKTILNAMGTTGGPVVSLSPGAVSSRYFGDAWLNFSKAIDVASGTAPRGSTTLTLNSMANVQVGTYLIIDQVNDGVIVTSVGNNGDCTFCDGGETADGSRAQGQISKVTAINGNVVTIFPALFTAYTRTPRATPILLMSEYNGVKDLQIYANNTGYTSNFLMAFCAYCWISGVEGNYADADHALLQVDFHSEVVDSYFSNAFQHAPGLTDSNVRLQLKTTGVLVQNNIFERLHSSIMMNWGVAGNVLAYNYLQPSFSNTTGYEAVVTDISFHGAHGQYILIEGNVGQQFGGDSTWGSYGNVTYARNYARGVGLTCNPLSTRATVTCTPFGSADLAATTVNGWFPFQAAWAFTFDALQSNVNLIGNVAGSPTMSGLSAYQDTAILPEYDKLIWPAFRSYDRATADYTFGYWAQNDDGTLVGGSTQAWSTLFLHGDYSNATHKITWATGVTHTLPASFYLASKPDWWTKGLPFPAIGPDVLSGAAGGGHAGMIPAQVCYTNIIGGKPGSAGSPYVFNADACYKGASTATLRGIGFSGMSFK